VPRYEAPALKGLFFATPASTAPLSHCLRSPLAKFKATRPCLKKFHYISYPVWLNRRMTIPTRPPVPLSFQSGSIFWEIYGDRSVGGQ